jgi:hypothetical protein
MNEGQMGIGEELHAELVDERDLVPVERAVLLQCIAQLEDLEYRTNATDFVAAQLKGLL